MDVRCNGCRYNTPKAKGGDGRICNGYTMNDHNRCPEWVINEYIKDKQPKTLAMDELVTSNRVREH